MKYDVIIIGGGLAGMTAGVGLLKAGLNCCAVSSGLSLHKEAPRAEFQSLGGTLLPGDTVVEGVWSGDKLLGVRTSNLGDTLLEADNFILSTGKFFSKGLVADMDGIVEPVFGADVEYDSCRDRWYDPDFFAPQPFERFGVRVQEGRVVIGGRPAANLFAAGEILAGEPDIVLSAMEVCRRII